MLAHAKKILKEANARLAAGEDCLEKLLCIKCFAFEHLKGKSRTQDSAVEDADQIDLPEGFAIGVHSSEHGVYVLIDLEEGQPLTTKNIANSGVERCKKHQKAEIITATECYRALQSKLPGKETTTSLSGVGMLS